MKDLWKAWGEDVEGSGQGVWLRSCLNGKCTKNLSGKLAEEWSGGSYKDEEVYTILLTTPQYHNLLSAVCALVSEIAGVQWMESPRVPHGSGASLSEPSLLTLRLVSDTPWETLYLLLA
jgi:hypothetical protein